MQKAKHNISKKTLEKMENLIKLKKNNICVANYFLVIYKKKGNTAILSFFNGLRIIK